MKPTKRVQHQVVLADEESAADLDQFVGRASQISNSSVRIVAEGTVLAVWAEVLAPRGIGDLTPTVLGFRAFRLSLSAKFDIVVPIESLRARIANAKNEEEGLVIEMPAETPSLRWRIPLPGRDGWESLGKLTGIDLQKVAAEGMKQIKKKIPGNAEERVVRSVRSQVWGLPINDGLGLPAGVAFGLEMLGFFGEKTLDAAGNGPWLRVSSSSGDVLAKRTPVVLDTDKLKSK